jgi:DNA-binding NarL/FixJ family response regulator
MRFSNGNVVDRRRAAQVSDDTALLRTRSRPIRISIVDSDPVRLVGFSAVFRSKREFRLQAATLSELMRAPRPDVVLLASCGMRNLFDRLFQLTSARPDLRILATGADMEREEVILKALVLGAKGCIDETSPAADFIKAVQVVHQGLVWAPRRACSIFIDVFTSCTPLPVPDRSGPVTDREREVLQLLTHGKSNREIGEALAIQERTVKGHLAKVMRKTGVRNRVELSLRVINQQPSLKRRS